MLIEKLSLSNFRNYSHALLDLHPGLNILVGENAQGKTNFLEAIELLSTGYSSRTSSEADFIQHGKSKTHIEAHFIARNVKENLALSLFNEAEMLAELGLEHRLTNEKPKKRAVFVNGVSYALLKKLRGRLITVTFNTFDLNLIRGGPSFRRDWIDSVIVRLKPAFYEQLSKYQKVVQQRNKLLKGLFESNHLSARDDDQLDAWNEQVAKYGAHIILWRRKALQELIIKAKHYLSLISDQNESLSISYRCRALEADFDYKRYHREVQNFHDIKILELPSATQHNSHDSETEKTIFQTLLHSLNKRKLEELVRGQTLSGPHRDDLIFLLNDKEATSFASQGQQRSLVLALKLSELELIKEHLSEPPVLLLDDVLAELDLKRQSLLMAQITSDMQTIISTTHISSFSSAWLENAHFFDVKSGTIGATQLQAVAR
jgi:DNA replication and repair protein RecF